MALDDVARSFTSRVEAKRRRRRERSRDRAERLTAFNALVDEEMKIFAFGETDERVLAETRAFVSSKIRAKSGSKKPPTALPLPRRFSEIAAGVVDR